MPHAADATAAWRCAELVRSGARMIPPPPRRLISILFLFTTENKTVHSNIAKQDSVQCSTCGSPCMLASRICMLRRRCCRRLLARLPLRGQLLAHAPVARPPVGVRAGGAAVPHGAAGAAEGKSMHWDGSIESMTRPGHPPHPLPLLACSGSCRRPPLPLDRPAPPRWHSAGRRSCVPRPPWPAPASAAPPQPAGPDAAAPNLPALLQVAAAAAAAKHGRTRWHQPPHRSAPRAAAATGCGLPA